jgi:hypothetical protein
MVKMSKGEQAMSRWNAITGRSKQGDTSKVQFPILFELIPARLTARVYLQEIGSHDGPVPCWTYVSDGLWAHKQKELIFSLRRSPRDRIDEFPNDPLRFFVTVYQFAEEGRLVDVWDFSEARIPDFLGHKGLMYIRPEPRQDFDIPAPALTAILLTDEELEARKAFGPTRVMVRLGQAYRYYPCPPWSDRMRSSLPFARTVEESILARVPHMWRRGFRVRHDGNRIVLRLLPKAGQELHAELANLPLNTPCALLTDLDPAANGCLVWKPGQTQLSAITPPNSDGSRLSGCFMLFVPGQPEDGGKYIEDGFGMLLADASWSALRQAIETRNPLSIPATRDGMSFSLEWIPTAYQNPFDGLVHYSEAGWETHLPDRPHATNSLEPIDVRHIILITPEEELVKRVTTQSFGAYTRSVEEYVQRHFAARPKGDGQELLVQFEVSPEGVVEMKMISYPGIGDEVLRDLHDHLVALPAPKVNTGPVRFQISFTIWGGPTFSELSKLFKFE